jgi:UDP-N-acetylmuramoyl-tripeptide--D-alanyl-D-alanine ligase
MNGGKLFVNGDEPLLEQAEIENVEKILVGISNENCDIRACNLRYDDDGSVFDIFYYGSEYKDVEISVIGKQFVYAALFAFAVGMAMGMEPSSIIRGLKKFENAAMRQNIYTLRGITIIEDCYNASPESMRAAMDVQKTISDSKKNARMVALLGDMRELGDDSESFHRSVGAYFAKLGGTVLVTAGGLAQGIAEGAVGEGVENVKSFADHNEVEIIGEAVRAELKEGDILLVKASRAIGAERIVEYIKNQLRK